jgi:hypothetical protein
MTRISTSQILMMLNQNPPLPPSYIILLHSHPNPLADHTMNPLDLAATALFSNRLFLVCLYCPYCITMDSLLYVLQRH